MTDSANSDSSASPYVDSGRRGLYFPKKAYSGGEIPTFREIRDRLPAPILEGNPEYLDLYWSCWELAFRGLKQPQGPSPFVSDYVDEAFSNCIFQWDTIFMLLFMRYAHHVFPAIESLDNFYCRQYESGYICRQIGEWDGEDYVFKQREDTINPPLWAWAEVESYRVTGDTSRFESVIPVIDRHAEWLERHMRKPDTAHGLFWNSPLGCGMDNIPLAGSGWVCMSSQMVLLYRNLAYMLKAVGRDERAGHYTGMADEIAGQINRHMWHADDGFYYNVDDAGEPLRVKTVAGFWPMLAGVADHQQARWLLFHLRNEKEFWRPLPFPSVAADEPTYICDGGYWLGGVWAPTNVMIIKGLERYGLETGAGTIFSFDEIATVAC